MSQGCARLLSTQAAGRSLRFVDSFKQRANKGIRIVAVEEWGIKANSNQSP